MERGDDRRRGQRRLDGEDRPPVEGLREDTAESGADRGAERSGADPEGDGTPAVTAQLDEQRQRRAEQEGGADSLRDPPANEYLEAVRQRTHDRRGQEDDQTGKREPGRPHSADEEQEPEGADDDGEVVGGHDPRDTRNRRLELDEELRQREDDDRRVGEGDRDRDGQGDLESQGSFSHGLGWDDAAYSVSHRPSRIAIEPSSEPCFR